MKIEMIVPTLTPAGMEMVVAILTRGLSKRGHDVGVTCLHRKGALGEALERDGHRVSIAPSPGLATILRPIELRRALRDRQPDVVHIHTGAWLKGARAARMAGVPRVILTMHGLDGNRPWFEPMIDRWAAHYADVLVPVSDAFVRYATNTLHVDPARVRVVTNGIDTNLFQPGPRSGRVRNNGLTDRDVVIGIVARFSPVKNHAMLIAAFAEVVRARPHAFLALVGVGRLKEDIEARVDQLGLRSRVAFLGQLSDLHEVYRDFDILTLPSFTEATSMSILEGMASGLPVVATAVGGTPALLDEGDAGVLVPSEDPAALAAALIRLIDSPDERVRLGELARRRAVDLHSQEHMFEAYEALYRARD